MKSCRCSGSSASSAVSRAADRFARIRVSISSRRSPRNMCSVRHRPMPCAPSLRARIASSGVSAFARTPSRRTASAWVSNRSTALTSADGLLVGAGNGGDSLLDVALHRRRHDRHRADVDLAGRAVDADLLALLDHGLADGDRLGGDVDVELLRAADAGLAHATGDDGGVRGLPAAGGEDAVGGDHPAEVVGIGLPADEQHLLAAAGPRHRGGGVEDHPADGRARRGRHAPGEQGPLRRTGRTAGTSAARAAHR